MPRTETFGTSNFRKLRNRGVLNNTKKSGHRPGVAITELAVCLPVLVLITLGAIETCSMIYMKQSLKIAAYEGARVALIPGTDNSNVRAQCDQILTDRQIRNGQVQISTNVRSARAGTFLRVTVSAPCNGNGFLTGFFFRDRTISASVEMMKEL